MANDEQMPSSGGQASRRYHKHVQARATETERKILEAASQMFAEHGYSGTRVSKVIAKSGCSTGSFYHQFADKRELYEVLQSRFLVDYDASLEDLQLEQANCGTLEGMFRELSFMIADFFRRHIGLYRAAMELAQVEPELLATFRGLTLTMWEKIERALPGYSKEIDPEQDRPVLQHAIQVIVALNFQKTLQLGVLFPEDKEAQQKLIVDAALGVINGAKGLKLDGRGKNGAGE